MTFTFVHAADLHLDTPFEGIERVSPHVAAALRDASLEAFDALVSHTLEADAAFLLVAGDIYDGPRRGVRAQLRFRRGLERLSEAGIRTLVVHGNHDPPGGWSAIRRWPPGVTVFGAGRVESVPVEREGACLAVVHGVSHGTREVTENLARLFRRGQGPGLQVGLLHCNAGANGEHAAYSPCTLEDLREAGLDYWALGHIHRAQNLSEGDPWIVYPGNLQGRSPKPSELGPKGAVQVEVRDGTVQQVTPVALDRVRFLAAEVDVSRVSDLSELEQVLTERGEELLRENEGRGLLLRTFLSGRGSIARDLRRPDALETVLGDLREDARGASPFLWWESLHDRTRTDLDLETIRRRGDFSAELMRLSAELAGDGDRLDAFLRARLKELPRSKLRRYLDEDRMSREVCQELARAEALALELLEEEDR